MQLGQVDINKLRGLSDKGLGFAKEVVGTIANNDRLVKEGDAQQSRAAEALRAMRKEVEAQSDLAKAGEITDNPDLRREGSAQREKGKAETDASKARAEAKAHEAKTKGHEVEQEVAQDAKQS
jgi:uncharacterized protein YjbJ (UPF0337 family)